MSDLHRTAQTLEVSFVKKVHVRDYENEDYSCSTRASFNRAMTPEESAVELAKLQAEVEYAIYSALYKRKLIVTKEYMLRIKALKAHLTALTGDSSVADYMLVVVEDI